MTCGSDGIAITSCYSPRILDIMNTSTHWTIKWHDRPREEAAHFNPAFCGELLARTIYEYQKAKQAPLALPLLFIILPLMLHPPTRRALPGRANTLLASWSAENEPILSDVPERVMQLRPITREALLFLSQIGAMTVNREGVGIGSTPLKLLSKLASPATAEVADIKRAASFLGRWFACQAAPAAILQTMGVRL
jgi:hypothetical protein